MEARMSLPPSRCRQVSDRTEMFYAFPTLLNESSRLSSVCLIGMGPKQIMSHPFHVNQSKLYACILLVLLLPKTYGLPNVKQPSVQQATTLTAPEQQRSSADLIARLKQIVGFMESHQSDLTSEQRFVMVLARYYVLSLEGDGENAGKAFAAAAELNGTISDSYHKAINDSALSVAARLFPVAERLPVTFRAKYVDSNASLEPPPSSERVIAGSPEWAFRELTTRLRELNDRSAGLQLGLAIQTFVDLSDRMQTVYPEPDRVSDATRVRFLMMATVVLSYERYLVLLNAEALQFVRNSILAPYESGVDAYHEAVRRFTDFSKKQVLETNLKFADVVASLDDARGASVLVEFARRMFLLTDESFAARRMFKQRFDQWSMMLPVLETLRSSYVRLRAGQIQAASVLLTGLDEEIKKLPDVTVREQTLGLFYRSRARIQMVSGRSAIDEYKNSIELLEKTNHLGVLSAWGELVQARTALREYEQAEADIKSGFAARDRLRSKYDETTLDLQSATLHVARITNRYMAQDYANLKTALDESTPIFEGLQRAVTNNVQTLAAIYAHHGFLTIKKDDDCTAAMPALKQAHKITRYAETQLSELVNLEMGKCLANDKQNQKAFDSLQKALQINRHLRRAARGSGAYAHIFHTSAFDEIQTTLHTVIFDMMSERGFGSEQLAQELLTYAELSKSRGIVDESESMRRGIMIVNPDTPPENVDAVNEILGDIFPVEDTQRNTQLAEGTFARHSEFVCKLGQRHRKQAVVLEYVPIVQRDRAVLFVITSTSANAVVLKTPWSKIVSTVDTFRRAIKQSMVEYTELRKSPVPDAAIVLRIKELERIIDRQGSELATMLLPADVTSIGNVAKYIEGKSLIVIPHGELHNLPFAALPITGNNAKPNLIDVVARFSTVASFTVLRSVVSLYDSNLRQTVRDVLLVGDPASSDLPSVQGEFEAIQKAIGSTSVVFQREGLKRYVQRSSAVHFGVHAFFNRSAIGKSGLSLQDGLLTIDEISMFEAHKTRVVTMGACESGESGVLPGDEVWGIATGFMFAGIPAVIGSLWNQDDEAARVFFSSFYGKLNRRVDVGAAFRTAMLETRGHHDVSGDLPDDLGLMRSRNPCFWAGFNFIGE